MTRKVLQPWLYTCDFISQFETQTYIRASRCVVHSLILKEEFISNHKQDETSSWVSAKYKMSLGQADTNFKHLMSQWTHTHTKKGGVW